MTNFSSICTKSLIGRFLRSLLKLIPNNVILPIIQGPLRGKKWIKGSGDNGYWLGSYELEKQQLFKKFVKNNDVVYDIGAHVGFYTLLASMLVGDGRVYAFEPLPSNIAILKKHIVLNKLTNVTVIEAAVSDKEGKTFFKEGESSTTGTISEKNGSFAVQEVFIDKLIETQNILPPRILKIDVEGTELSVLQGARRTLRQYKPIIFLATHSQKLYQECHVFLSQIGYNIKDLDAAKGEVITYS